MLERLVWRSHSALDVSTAHRCALATQYVVQVSKAAHLCCSEHVDVKCIVFGRSWNIGVKNARPMTGKGQPHLIG